VFTCLSEYDRFEAWASLSAHKFREQIEACYNDIADWSVNDLYVNDSIMQPKKKDLPKYKHKRNAARKSTAMCQ